MEIETFELEPFDFGLPVHALSEVSPGKSPEQNAETLLKILGDQQSGAPVVGFKLLNTGGAEKRNNQLSTCTQSAGSGEHNVEP